MKTIDENESLKKERHGCVTSWLVLMIIANSICSFAYFFSSEKIQYNLGGDISTSTIMLLGVICVANIIFAIMIFSWKKIGFWGFVITSLIAVIINLNIGLGIVQSISGLIGIAILYGILNMKKNNTTTWKGLE